MTQIRTPEGFQNLGTQAAFTASGEIPVGTRYASMDAIAAAGLKLPPATAIGGSFIVVENLSGANTVDLSAASGETINGGAAPVTVAVSSSVMVLRSGPTDVRVIEF